jgi:hypothetical protein
MTSLARAERKASRFIKENVDIDELYDQLDTLRSYVQELSSGVGKNASREFQRARALASGAAHDAEEAMKDNLAASLVVALGLGVLVGYFIGRGNQ